MIGSHDAHSIYFRTVSILQFQKQKKSLPYIPAGFRWHVSGNIISYANFIK